ncbi:hypothetical protein [Marilutibacter aestuarii]|nr:hypothetical protein [Lysobacter aestuarii]
MDFIVSPTCGNGWKAYSYAMPPNSDARASTHDDAQDKESPQRDASL